MPMPLSCSTCSAPATVVLCPIAEDPDHHVVGGVYCLTCARKLLDMQPTPQPAYGAPITLSKLF